MHEQAAAGLGDVEVVLEEALDGEQGLGVQALNAALLEHFPQEHLAQGGGQLVDQTGNAQVIVADDGLLGVEHLAHFHGHLGLLEAGGQVLHVADGGANAHHSLDVVLAGEGVHDGGGQLFDVPLVNAAADLLHQNGVGLADVEHEVLLLVREQAADHVVGGDVGAGGDADEQHHAGHIGGEVQFPGLGVDVAGEDVVQHHVLDEVGLVELFVVVLLDALQADGHQAGELAGGLVGALHIHSVVVVLVGTELMVGAAAALEAVAGQALGGKAVPHFPDHVQIRAGDDGAGLVHDAHRTANGVLHLVHDALKYSVRHRNAPLFCNR